MSTMAVTANASVNTVLSGPPPPARQSVRKRTAASVSTRGANREAVAAEEELSLSQTATDNVYGKDFSHTIRGETVLESIPGSKNIPSPARKALKSSFPQSPRNDNPSTPSSPKTAARLHYLGGVFTKVFMVFILVAVVGTAVWKWNLHRNEPSEFSLPVGLSVSEGRILELEELLRKTTNMMQVQLQTVDMEIGKQVEKLRKELEDKIEEQTSTFLTELRNLEAHTGEIEESLLKLADTGVMSKREVLELVNSVVDEWAIEAKGHALSLDDVRAVAKRIVEAEMEKLSADGLGMVDYALGSGGGKVVRHSEGYYVGVGKSWSLDSLNFLKRSSVHPYASKILEPSFGEPGQCLPLKGTNVFVDIALRTSVLPEAITLEHVAKSVAYDRSSAPKDFRIFGRPSQYKDDAVVESEEMFKLGEFSYDLEKGSAQTFYLPVASTGEPINMIRLDVLSNHGSPSHTCIYRLRVHGSVPKSHMAITNEL